MPEARLEMMSRSLFLAVLIAAGLFSTLGARLQAQTTPDAPESITLEVSLPEEPKILLAGHPVTLHVEALGPDGERATGVTGFLLLQGARQRNAPLKRVGPLENGALSLHAVTIPKGRVTIQLEGTEIRGELERPTIPAVLTLLPALVAILLSLWTRQVLLSLFCGLWIGVAMLESWNPFTSFFTSVDTYLVQSLASADHAHIILFSLSLAGMVGVIHHNGGIHGIVQAISRFTRTARSGQVSTCFLGCLIFFDDYANSLIVGNTMRSFTDRVRISREKLAFLVDSTAAPVATVGIISTWTAYQLGVLDSVLPALEPGEEAYLYFLGSIPYAFYSILMLGLVYLVAFSLRDFGPMRRAEERTRQTGEVLREGAEPLTDTRGHSKMAEIAGDGSGLWWLAAVPIVALIAMTIAGLWITGRQATAGQPDVGLEQIIGNSDSYKALLWAAVAASTLALGLSLLKGHRLGAVIDSWVEGASSLRLAVMILLLAWSISAICKDLRTGEAVASLVPEALDARWLPAITFVTAGLIAFSTGTSYGTMGILIPILLPLTYELARRAGLDPEHVHVLGSATLASILGGAVFGDHCSPISDTTVLSSMAAGSDHIDHVKTQFPYALLVGSVAIPCYLLIGYEVSIFLVLPLGLAATGLLHWILSRGSGGSGSSHADIQPASTVHLHLPDRDGDPGTPSP